MADKWRAHGTPRTFKGTIFRNNAPVWNCIHTHYTLQEAKECAQERLKKVRGQNASK